MKRLTFRRGSLPALIGIGAVVIGVAAGTWIEVAGSGPPGGPAAQHRAAAAAGGPAGGGSAQAAGTAVSLPLAGSSAVPSPSQAPPSAPAPAASATPGSPPRQLIVPDIVAAAPGGITPAELAAISRLGPVRAVLPFDGARVTVNGGQLNVLAAPAAQLRSWAPPEMAAASGVWSDFARGDLIATSGAAASLHLVAGQSYPATGAAQLQVTAGAAAQLGIPGVDAIVSQAQGSRLGLVPNVAVLINAPAASMDTLASQVQGVLGHGSQAIRLAPEQVSTQLPVKADVPSGRPASYLTLYQESAAEYCPGLSWTVLAAIGEIESDDGRNVGPSSAGALGPMQFLPSTWALWGTDGFGDTGKPDIMNPFDAVPSAARLLCADGAGRGGTALETAIFDYNHATWYVDEVLTLAGEYARAYG